MNRNLAGLLAATAGLALPLVASAVPATDMVVLAPRYQDDEFVGPNTILTVEYNTPASAGLVVGQAIDAVSLYGVNAAGARVTAAQDATVGLGGAPLFAASTDQSFTIDIAGAGISGFIDAASGNPNIVAIEVVASTEGNAGLTDGVSTAIDSADETVDETLEIDIVGPKIVNVYTNGANDRLFFVFDEPLQGVGGPGDNDTDLTNVDDNTFQFLATGSANAFDAATQTVNGAGFAFTVDADFVDNSGDSNTTIGVDVTADDFPIGTIFRAAADDDGLPTHGDIFDLVGNEAFQSDANGDEVETGVLATATPTFEVVSADWTTTGGPGDNITARVTFSLPVSGAALGDTDYYNEVLNSLGDLLETSGNPDFVAFDVDPDPDDTSSVLVDFAIDGGAEDDVAIWADGQSTDGQTFQLRTDAAGGTPPDSIFSDTIATDDTVDIGDAIAPSYQGLAFLDLDNDGDLDAVAAFFDEPVTSDIAVGDVELNKVAGTVFPFDQITADGELTEDDVEAAADPDDDEITVASTTAEDVVFDTNAPDRLAIGNAQAFSFDPTGVDWDEDGDVGAADTDGEATPGTGDADVLSLDFTDGVFTDGSGNESTESLVAELADEDRAVPVFVSLCHYEGDNQAAGSNTQYWRELEDGAFTNPPFVDTDSLGDNQELDRLALVFSEEMDSGGFDPNEVFVDGVPIFDGGSTFFDTDNAVTIVNDSQESSLLAPGASVTVREEANLSDTSDNAATVDNAVAEACTGPYVAYQADINGNVIHGAVAVDTNNDGTIDQININFNEAINVDDLTLDDFDITSPASAEATGLAAGSSDAEVVITLDTTPANAVSTVTDLTVRYNSTVGDPLITGANGAVSQLASQAADNNAALTPISLLVDPSSTGGETDSVSSMLISGTISIGGTPAPIGTKVFGMIAVPTVDRIVADHNGIKFEYERGDNYSATSSSVESITNWLLGLENYVYLHRYQNNEQEFSNFKDDGESFGGDGDDYNFVTDIIDLDFTFRSFTSVTFRGTGETRTDIVSGTVFLCWDVLRSNNGTTESLHEDGFGSTPILSRAVVAGSNGAYEIEVGAPITSFTGKSRIDSTDFPVIMVIELPNGQRYAASSLLNAADRDGPILFQSTNQTEVPASFDFDVELNNIGVKSIWEGWNTVGFDRASGVADSGLPTLPTGVVADDIEVGLVRDLPAAEPLDQFVYWSDDNRDGQWTVDDDNGAFFDTIIVDADCIRFFGFSMTNLGVQFGSGMTSLVGGYGFGFFNGSGDPLGCFQFGPEIAPGVPFAAFPASGTNLGWVLATATQDIDVSANLTGLGTGADFAIQFINDDQSFFTRSAGTGSHGELETVGDGTAVFIHYGG